jgi:hypothetical protein
MSLTPFEVNDPPFHSRSETLPRRLRIAVSPDHGREQLIRLVLAIYALVILEGVLRKWMFPALSQPLFFLRDPIVLWTYLLATRYRLWPRTTTLVLVFGGLALASLGIVMIQQATTGFSLEGLLLAGYGWRNYFLYPPLAFVIGQQLRSEDLARMIRWTLWISIPIAVLVAIQFWAPLNSPINVGFATEKAEQFRGLSLTQDHTRPMGLFTSVLGQTLFVSSLFSILLVLVLIPPSRRPVGRLLLLCGLASCMTCFALGGSRAAVLHCGLSLASASYFAFFGKNRNLRIRGAVLPLAVLVGVLIIYPIAFPEGFEAFTYRWTVADKLESAAYTGGVFGRAFFNLIDFARLMNDTPLFGFGLGLGGNASTTLGATIHGAIPLNIAETEWSRQIVDLGPVFGLFYIVYRVALTFSIGTLVLRASRRNANPLPLLLYSFIGPELLYGLVTGHGTVNGYTWLFVGFVLASCRLALTDPRGSRGTFARSSSGSMKVDRLGSQTRSNGLSLNRRVVSLLRPPPPVPRGRG